MPGNTTSLYTTTTSANTTIPANNNTSLYNGTGNPIGVTTNISVTGNIAAGGWISAVGNVYGNYFIGNGAFLTGINANSLVGGYSNANVVAFLGSGNSVVISTTGNIYTSGNTACCYLK
jgi:hypothetical protein